MQFRRQNLIFFITPSSLQSKANPQIFIITMASLLNLKGNARFSEAEKPVIYRVSLDKVERINRSRSALSDDSGTVVGSTILYNENGEVILCPTPTPDPKGMRPVTLSDVAL